MSGNSTFDEMLKGIGAGISDVREKLVEQAFFGQSFGDSHAPVEITVAEKSATPSFQEYAREAAAHDKRDERTPQEPDHER
jgi:hypothetical protein